MRKVKNIRHPAGKFGITRVWEPGDKIGVVLGDYTVTKKMGICHDTHWELTCAKGHTKSVTNTMVAAYMGKGRGITCKECRDNAIVGTQVGELTVSGHTDKAWVLKCAQGHQSELPRDRLRDKMKTKAPVKCRECAGTELTRVQRDTLVLLLAGPRTLDWLCGQLKLQDWEVSSTVSGLAKRGLMKRVPESMMWCATPTGLAKGERFNTKEER